MDNRDYRNYNEEKNKRFKGTFYIVISVITLVVAIIGASFSYFIATASSAANAIQTGSTGFELEFQEYDKNLINTDLIPVDSDTMLYSAIRQKTADLVIVDETTGLTAYDKYSESGRKSDLANTKCRDDNGNAICSAYRFTVTNPLDLGVEQTLVFKIQPSVNEFGNLYMAVYHLNSITVENPSNNEEAGVVFDDYWLKPSNMLDGYFTFSGDYEWRITLAAGDYATYEILLYINNIDDDQTEVDANKTFAAAVVIQPEGTDSNEIKGVISASGWNVVGPETEEDNGTE